MGLDSAIGMALHMILYSMKKEYVTWNGTHTIFHMEGRSWRKDIYPDYKGNRKVVYAALTEKEQEDQEILQGAFDDLVSYLDQQTNITVLRNPKAEADDMIAIFIEAHPDDNHVLVSSDSDFYQLLRFGNLTIYDPVKDIRIQRDGIFNDKGERLAFHVDTNAKIKVGKPDPSFTCDPDWYNYALFLKCVRGDKTDNIFSAYPGVREKGTQKTVGIREAYEDKNKGFAWNNFMLQRWVDHNQQEQKVKDKFDFNCQLIDLSKIPQHVKDESLAIIAETTGKKNVPAVEIGVGFMKFCGRWALQKIGNNSAAFMPMLKSKYES